MAREEKHSQNTEKYEWGTLNHLFSNDMGTRSILISFISGGDSFAEIWALSLTNHPLQKKLKSERIRFISSKTENEGFALKDKLKFLETGAIRLHDAKFFNRRIGHYESKLIEKAESGLLHIEEAPAVDPELSNVKFIVDSIRSLEQKRYDIENALDTIRRVEFNAALSPRSVCIFFNFGIHSLMISAFLLAFVYFFITLASMVTGNETPVKVHGVDYADRDHSKTIWLILLGVSAGFVIRRLRAEYKTFLKIKNTKNHINRIQKNAETSLLKMADDLQRRIVDTNASNIQLRAIQDSSLLPNQSTRHLIMNLRNYWLQFIDQSYNSIQVQNDIKDGRYTDPQDHTIKDETTISWFALNSQLDESRRLLSNVDADLVRLLSTPLIPITPSNLLLSMKFHTSQRVPYSSEHTTYPYGLSFVGKLPKRFPDSVRILNEYLPSSSEDGAGNVGQRANDGLELDTFRQPLLEEDQRANGPHRV